MLVRTSAIQGAETGMFILIELTPGVLRLWDTYFSCPEGLNLHVYVCLSILNYLKDELEELEQSEIHSVLSRLPLLDMDKIIIEAFRLKNEATDHNLNVIGH